MSLDSATLSVLQVIQRALTPNIEDVKLAEVQLKKWESDPGFYSILESIFNNYNIDPQIRFLAAVFFKNGVDRFWRRNADNAIPDEEKAMLRCKLLNSCLEPSELVARQLAVIISKIARMDCPRLWPELVPFLVESVKSQQELVQRRALLMFHQTTKALASKRLGSDRKEFEELASNIFDFVKNLWSFHNQNLLNSPRLTPSSICLDQSSLALKVLQKFVISGFREPQLRGAVIKLVPAVIENVPKLLRKRMDEMGNEEIVMSLEKYIVLHMKLLLNIQESHSDSFVPFIRQSVEFIFHHCFSPAQRDVLFEKFNIYAINLLKFLLTSDHLMDENHKGDASYQEDLRFVRENLLSPPNVLELLSQLLNFYIPFTPKDLELWEADPEEFCTDEYGEAWRYSVRVAAENLFMSVFSKWKTILVEPLAQMIVGWLRTATTNLNELLQKDAVLNIAGLASWEIYDHVNFDEWLIQFILPELRSEQCHRIIRRRYLWLIAHWVSTKLSQSLRPLLYQLLMDMLAPQYECVIRLTAAQTLRTAVDDIEFDQKQFVPFLEPSFMALLDLLKSVNECSTKMQVLSVLSLVIERVGADIRPMCAGLVNYLPLLWGAAGQHNMLRNAIVTTLDVLVQGLGPLSESLQQFVLGVVHQSTDLSGEYHVYLLEEGLQLWLSMLHNAPRMNEAFIRLFQNMVPLLELGSESLKVCFQIIEASLLLDPADFLNNYGTALVHRMVVMLQDMKPEAAMVVARCAELILKVDHARSVELLPPLLIHVTTSLLEGEIFPRLVAAYLALLTRTFLTSAQCFNSIVQQVANQSGREADATLGALLDVWLERFEFMHVPEKRKVFAVAVGSMLTWNSPVILSKFGSFIDVFVSVLNDIQNDDNGFADEIYITLSSKDDTPSAEENETQNDLRRRTLRQNDMCEQTDLKQFISQKLQECQQLYGEELFTQLMEQADPVIRNQLIELLNR